MATTRSPSSQVSVIDSNMVQHFLAISDETTVTATHLDTGEILSEHTIAPTHRHRRNQLAPPG